MGEGIEIYSYVKCLEPVLSAYKSKAGQEFSITNIRGIVLHQADQEIRSPGVFISDLINSKKNPYHFIITKNGNILQLNNVERALLHCKSNKYTEFANNYFGDTVAPLYEDTVNSPHPESSPDNSTISVLISANENDTIYSNVYNSLIKLCAYIINKYSKSLEATSNIIGAFEISNSFDDPSTFKTNSEAFTKFKFEVEKLRAKWFVEYNGYKRGYPEEKINIMDYNEN